MCTVKYYLDTRSKKDKKAITMRVNHAGKSFNRGTGISISPDEWDSKMGYPKDKTSAEFTELAAMEGLLNNTYKFLKQSLRCKPGIIELKIKFEEILNEGTVDKDNTITGLIQDFIAQKKGIYSESAIKHYEKLKMLVKDKFGGLLEDNLDHLNKTWALKFIDYLCYHQGYQNSTVEMYLKKLNSVLNFFDKPIIKISEVMTGMKKSKSVNADKPYLTFDQMNSIEDFVCIKYNSLDVEYEVMELFVWCCYTGMRYNEAVAVTTDMVDNNNILTYTTSKNGKRISVPLNDWCLNLLDEVPFAGLVFRGFNNSKCNRVLTKILKEYGMNDTVSVIRYSGKNMEVKEKSLAELITFHSSRHSFASNLLDGGLTFQEVSDLMGISVQTLMSWYSHSNEEMRNSKALAILNR